MCWHCSQPSTHLPPTQHIWGHCLHCLGSLPPLFVASYQVLLNPADVKESPDLYWVCVAKFW